VPCSSETSLGRNVDALLAYEGLSHDQIQAIGQNALSLFPGARSRIEAVQQEAAVPAYSVLDGR
jgi:hypothetical protein